MPARSIAVLNSMSGRMCPPHGCSKSHAIGSSLRLTSCTARLRGPAAGPLPDLSLLRRRHTTPRHVNPDAVRRLPAEAAERLDHPVARRALMGLHGVQAHPPGAVAVEKGHSVA